MKVKVETVELTKKVYIVDVDDGGNPKWACDSVVCGDVDPVSSEYLDFTIFGHHVLENADD